MINEELDEFLKAVKKAKEGILNGELDKYLKTKGQESLERIMKEQDVDSDQRADEYLAGNKVEINRNEIVFYNDSEIDIESADTWLNDYGKLFYPDKLSLAELIEYGTGLVGKQSSKGIGEEWEYMANENRKNGKLKSYEDGWDWNNQSYPNSATPTQGQAGRYIYYGLTEDINSNADNWFNEYLDSVTGGML